MNHASKNDYRKVENMVRRVMRLMKRKEYELDMPNGAIQEAIDRTIVIDHPQRRSFADRDCIVINTGSWWRKKGIHPEYARFAKDPVIGSLSDVSPDDALFALVAHEVAHYIQFRYAPRVHLKNRKRFSDWRKPHGHTFQNIYRNIRKDLVNPERLEKEMA